ncbi:MAG: hypothetical protein IPQ21_08990 [Betaproteobacteria bacterium]|nr:hypothetical protein [Betaproteobacteria bacterium]
MLAAAYAEVQRLPQTFDIDASPGSARSPPVERPRLHQCSRLLRHSPLTPQDLLRHCSASRTPTDASAPSQRPRTLDLDVLSPAWRTDESWPCHPLLHPRPCGCRGLVLQPLASLAPEAVTFPGAARSVHGLRWLSRRSYRARLD